MILFHSTALLLAILGLLAEANHNFDSYGPPGKTFTDIRDGSAVQPAYPKSRNLTVPEDPALANARILTDTGVYGPEIELVHLYHNYWPTGLAVTSKGRVFTCFPRGNESYTLAEWVNSTYEKPYPNLRFNTPTPSLLNASTPGYSVATNDSLIFVQSVIVDGKDRLWALDVGRPTVKGVSQLAKVPGGPKIVRFNLETDEVAQIITFPENVVFADSSLNDLRVDLRPYDGFPEGVIYLTDSSPQHAGIVTVNIATSRSWRYVDNHQSVQIVQQFVPVYDGRPFYTIPSDPSLGRGIQYQYRFASDGLALGSNGEWLYYSPLASRRLYRVPTDLLRNAPGPDNAYGNLLVDRAVQDLGEKGSHSDGLETDSKGRIYLSAPEHNAIFRYVEETGLVQPFVRDPRMQFIDTMAVVDLASGSYVYWTSNQLFLSPDYNNNTDLRVKPYTAWRVRISDAGKAKQLS